MKKPRHLVSVPADQLPKGPNGRNLCRWCQKEVPPNRKTMCSDECSHEYGIRCNSAYARHCTYKRDRGVCALCGVDTDKLARVCQKLARSWSNRRYMDTQYSQYMPAYGNWNPKWKRKSDSMIQLDLTRLQKIAAKYPWLSALYSQKHECFKMSLWQMDHILPVSEGGGSCGLENLRTLCIGCHNKETNKLTKRRTRVKRVQKQIVKSLIRPKRED